MNGLLGRTLSRDEFEDMAERFLAGPAGVAGDARRAASESIDPPHAGIPSNSSTSCCSRISRRSICASHIEESSRSPWNCVGRAIMIWSSSSCHASRRMMISPCCWPPSDVTLLCRICNSELGAAARDVLVGQAERLLEDACVDLAFITVDCEGADVGGDAPVLSHIRVTSHRTWSSAPSPEACRSTSPPR
jgi:hypothetical protein